MRLNKVVDFSTAKLLKEKGFNEICEFGLHLDGSEHDFKKDWLGLQKNSYLAKNYFTRPTIADVVMWLYEKHKIWVEVHGWTNQPVGDETWKNCFQSFVNGDATDVRIFKSPTEAYEAAIDFTLTNLI